MDVPGSEKMVKILDFFSLDTSPRRFLKKNGLFKQGVKLSETLDLSIEEQVYEILKLPGVKSFDIVSFSYYVDLGWAGKYHVRVDSSPIADRLEGNRRTKNNPFLSSGGGICLGNQATAYERCYSLQNILECVKIINAVLSSPHDSHGFGRWPTSTLVRRQLNR